MANLSLPSSDLHGASTLTVSAIVGMANILEHFQLNLLKVVDDNGVQVSDSLPGATRFGYRLFRGVTQVVGRGINGVLTQLQPLLGENSNWPGRETTLAVLNGVLGDYLQATHNPLAIQMQLRRDGKVLPLRRAALTAALPEANGRVLLLVHGLCMNDLQWSSKQHNHGLALARDLGYTPVFLHYNTGQHISVNGRLLGDLLTRLQQQWPVPIEELVIVGHSMGGLVARSACHYAGLAQQPWLPLLSKLVCMASPHHGAPLERGGNWFHVITDLSALTRPFSQLGKIRSCGITDLRYGNIIDEDWGKHDRFAHVGDQRHAVPLPQNVQCYAMAATTGKQAGDISDRLIGDGLVPLDSALGRDDEPGMSLDFAPQNQWIGYELNHLEILQRPDAYQQLLAWLK